MRISACVSDIEPSSRTKAARSTQKSALSSIHRESLMGYSKLNGKLPLEKFCLCQPCQALPPPNPAALSTVRRQPSSRHIRTNAGDGGDYDVAAAKKSQKSEP